MDKQGLISQSALLWTLEGKFVNEARHPLEFVKHRFLIDYMNDYHPNKVTKKCSQVGLTVAETLIEIHLAAYRRMTTIHTLQTNDVIKGFVVPKVNPIIENNPDISKLVIRDSENLKQFRDGFVFFRGAQSETQAVNITADVLTIDELDRSNAKVVEMYQSRLDSSDYRWRRRFSNPSAVGYGVDALYEDSDQMHWFVTCSKCRHSWYLDWEYDSVEQNHYVDQEREIFACGKCHHEITDSDRIKGRWIPKYPNRTHMRGYWFSQLMSPWHDARSIIQKHNESTVDYFYNFVLGKAYTPTDLKIDRSVIIKATSPSTIAKKNVALGVDNGIVKTWVLGTPDGIFAHGQTKSWDDIEKMILMYNPVTVIDPNPYPTDPKRLVDKYKRQVYICYFKQDTTGLKIVTWGEKEKAGVVYADRTKIIDLVAGEIVKGSIRFRESPYKLEDYIYHWSNLYRATKEDENGRMKSEWLKIENKPNDYALATVYWRIALSKVIGGRGMSMFVEPGGGDKEGTADYVDKQGQLVTNLSKSIEKAFEPETDWRHD